MKPTRPADGRPWTHAHAGEGGPPAAQAGRGEALASVCPLIPGRFKYTCSGRCKGCDERREHNLHNSGGHAR